MLALKRRLSTLRCRFRASVGLARKWRAERMDVPSLESLGKWILSNALWVLGVAFFLRLWAWLTDRRFNARKEIAFWVFVPAFLFFAFAKFGLVNRPDFKVSVDRIHVMTAPLSQAIGGGMS